MIIDDKMNVDNRIGGNGATDIINAVCGLTALKAFNINGISDVLHGMINKQETMWTVR